MSDNLERAAMLLDIVQKVASVAPAYTALSSIAMAELKEMNQSAQEHLNKLGQQRLAAEQEAAAELSRQNAKAAKEQAEIDARNAERNAQPRPITIMPGEPVPNAVRKQVGEIDQETDTPQFPEEPESAPVTRRV